MLQVVLHAAEYVWFVCALAWIVLACGLLARCNYGRKICRCIGDGCCPCVRYELVVAPTFAPVN